MNNNNKIGLQQHPIWKDDMQQDNNTIILENSQVQDKCNI